MSRAEEIVQFAEDAHASMDVDRMLECFEDDIVAYWNGRRIAANKTELAAWYHAFFDGQQHFELSKTLRADAGDILTVEWTHRRTDADGQKFEGHAAEIWYLSERGRLREWRAHCNEYPLAAT